MQREVYMSRHPHPYRRLRWQPQGHPAHRTRRPGRAGGAFPRHVSGNDVQHVVFGNVVHTEAKDMYLSRVAAKTPASPRTRLR